MDRLAGALVIPELGADRPAGALVIPELGADRPAGALVIPALGADRLACVREAPELGEGRATPPLGVRGEDAPAPPRVTARSEGLAEAPAAGLPWAEGLPPPARAWDPPAAAAPPEAVLEAGVLAAGVPALPPTWLTRSEGLALEST